MACTLERSMRLALVAVMVQLMFSPIVRLVRENEGFELCDLKIQCGG